MIDTGLPNVSIFESFLATAFPCLYFLKAFLSHLISLCAHHHQFANWSFAACLCVIVKDLEFVVANKVTRVINCAGT